jgi:rhamnogalacturonyl hydrolase YesR
LHRAFLARGFFLTPASGVARAAATLACGWLLAVALSHSSQKVFAAERPVTRSVAEKGQRALAWAERVAGWQLAQRGDFTTIPRAGPETKSSRDWQRAAFYIGLAALADRSKDSRFREAVLANGRSNNWSLSPRPFHADDQAIAATYLWAVRNGGPSEAAAAFRERADAILAANPSGSLEFIEAQGPVACQLRWCWSDALFMAPAAWLELARPSRDTRYAAFAHREFKATADYLFDDEQGLFYRDSRFFSRRGPDGEKLFWSRGNGWAFAGLTRVIDALPKHDRHRAFYVSLFRAMAKRLIAIQKPDGYWSPSLLAKRPTPPEASGTGFFVHGLAWGLNNEILDRGSTLPAVRRGWSALRKAVQPDGMVGWVQQVSDRPDAVAATDTQYYGVSAFLLASTQISDLEARGWKMDEERVLVR